MRVVGIKTIPAERAWCEADVRLRASSILTLRLRVRGGAERNASQAE